MLLKDKVAVVYGGSGAVGGAVARAYAREGARVFVAAPDRAALERVAAEIGAAAGSAEVTIVDTTSAESIQAHLDAVVAAAGPVRLMFNGLSWADTQGSSMAAMHFAELFEPIRLSVTHWFHTGTIMAQHMGQHGGGSIVGITRNVARGRSRAIDGFGIACAAVEHFLHQLGREYGPLGVRVCWVCSPGSSEAPGIRNFWQTRAGERGIGFEDPHRDYAKTTLRRNAGLAQIADAAVLLSSDLASALTATVAHVTGGGPDFIEEERPC